MRRRRRGRRGGADVRRDDEFALERALLEEQQPTFSAWHVTEPGLRFGGGHSSVDPKSGLALYGPLAAEERPLVRVGVIGTGDTVDRVDAWLDRARSRVQATGGGAGRRIPSPILFPSFPGLSSALHCDMRRACSDLLTDREIELIAGVPDFGKRIDAAVRLIEARMRVLLDKPSRPDVVIVALPKAIEESCRTAKGGKRAARVPLTSGQQKVMHDLRRDEDRGQRLMFDVRMFAGIPDEAVAVALNLHRQLKIRGMQVGMPTQLVWQSTLEGGAGRQDPATITWNMAVGLYYKAGGIPWQVEGLDHATCYVGIAFYREQGASPAMRTSMAQAFSDTGDGIVLRGEAFEWDEEQSGRSPHLPRESARRLLRQVLEAYEKATRHAPGRVVLHKSSRFETEELAGFREALGGVPHHDLVALGPSRMRFLRVGTEPPVRGTAIALGGGRHLLYTRGYIPYLRAYPGLRVPEPLELREHHGTGSIRKVCAEIMAMTKMNWNSADFACSDPITLAFAREVGLILAEMPANQVPANSYRYYM